MRRAACAIALLASACGKKDAANPTGSAAPVGSGSAVVAGSAAAPVAAAADPKAALDAALKAKGIAAKDVAKRVDAAQSSWALVVTKSRDNGFYITQYTVIRAGADGVAEVHIDPHEGGKELALGKDIDAFDVRDLDGNGQEECIAVLEWQRDLDFAAQKCKGCQYGWGDGGKQLYVLFDKGGTPAVAFTHLVEYTVTVQTGDAVDPHPPHDEKIAYDYKVEGTPPHVSLTRTDNELNDKRPKGLLDPATDPLLAAGSGSDVPLVLK